MPEDSTEAWFTAAHAKILPSSKDQPTPKGYWAYRTGCAMQELKFFVSIQPIGYIDPADAVYTFEGEYVGQMPAFRNPYNTVGIESEIERGDVFRSPEELRASQKRP